MEINDWRYSESNKNLSDEEFLELCKNYLINKSTYFFSYDTEDGFELEKDFKQAKQSCVSNVKIWKSSEYSNWKIEAENCCYGIVLEFPFYTENYGDSKCG